MAFLLFLSIISILFPSKSSAELITALPGQPAKVGFKQYSGYIVTNARHGRALFYYFVEAQSPNPYSRPLTLWLNGGPGCSSVGLGAFMEHGPFKPTKNGSLIQKHYSWNLESNMLYVESPVGVGFSYSNPSSDYKNWTDANRPFLLNWYDEFPKYRDSDSFLTGHYVPQLALLILNYNAKSDQNINLKAIALGNPVLDLDISYGAEDFLWAHGVITDNTRQLLKEECNISRLLRQEIYNNYTGRCIFIYSIVSSEMGYDVSIYDLLMPVCVSGQSSGVRGRTVGDPCLMNWIFNCLNRPEVQRALYANTTGLHYNWTFCEGPLYYQYENLDTNLIPVIEDLINASIPIWLYSGDQDARIPLTQTRTIATEVAKRLGLFRGDLYGPWYNKKQVGGWTLSYYSELGGLNKTSLTFATVRGAGQQVPFTSPSEALTLFRSFLNGTSLPRSD